MNHDLLQNCARLWLETSSVVEKVARVYDQQLVPFDGI